MEALPVIEAEATTKQTQWSVTLIPIVALQAGGRKKKPNNYIMAAMAPKPRSLHLASNFP